MQQVLSRECTSCGQLLPHDARFCSKCGHSQDEPVGNDGGAQPARRRPDDSSTKVFVGGLSAQTELYTLQAYFEQYGALVDSVVMKDKASGRPRGFGFVTFENPDSLELVMQAADQHQIDGKMVEVKRCEPRADGAQAMHGPPSQHMAPSYPPQLHGPGYMPYGAAQHPRPSFGRPYPMMQPVFPAVRQGFRQPPPVVHQGRPAVQVGGAMITDKVFIGGLGECSEDILDDYFGQFGSIIDRVVMRDKVTRKPRGFGFVQFDHPEAVDALMVWGHEPGVDGTQLETSSFHSLNGRPVEVKRASPKPGQDFSFMPPRQDFFSMPPLRPAPQPQFRMPERHFAEKPNRDRSNKVFVGGLGECLDEEFQAHFSQFGHLIDCIVMKDKATGKSRGFGFVQYDDPAAVDMVLSQQHEINGRWVEVKQTVPEDSAGLKGGGKGKARASPYMF